jgi:hypothetical protein
MKIDVNVQFLKKLKSFVQYPIRRYGGSGVQLAMNGVWVFK